MAVESDADRAAFFDSDDFGGLATVTITATGETFDVEGIYDGLHFVRGVKQDNQFTSAHSADVSGQKPVFRTQSRLLAGVKSGRATISLHTPFFDVPTEFTVFDVAPDGTGTTILKLMKA